MNTTINVPYENDLPANELQVIAKNLRSHAFYMKVKDDEYARVAFILLKLDGEKIDKEAIANFIQKQQQDLKHVSEQKWQLVNDINDSLTWASNRVKGERDRAANPSDPKKIH